MYTARWQVWQGVLILMCLALLPDALEASSRGLSATKRPPRPSSAVAEKAYFIFGYGSLLNTASTSKSNCGLAGFAEGDLDGLQTL